MRKIKIGVLALTILVLGSVSVFAAEFSDVPGDAWYAKYVSELSDKGIVKGYSSGKFLPENNVTCAEALKLVLQSSGYEIEELSTPEELQNFWGSDVIATAEKQGVIAPKSVDGKSAATRQQIADFIVNAMKWQDASHIESVFADTDNDNTEILYQKGIITGVAGDNGYYYNPNQNLKRSEVCAIVHRIYDFDPLKLQPVMKGAEGFLFKNPKEVADFEKVLLYMANKNLTELEIAYPGSAFDYTFEAREKLCDNAVLAQQNLFAKYHEYFCYVNTLNISTDEKNGVFVMRFDAENTEFSSERIKSMRSEFFKLTEQALQKLISDGKITAAMSEKEKAKAVYDWVCQNCKYDYEFKAESFLGYGAVSNGEAVCQGYTALFNTMCKQLGIWCQGISGVGTLGNRSESHIWTYAKIDGQWTYLDVTFDDTVSSDFSSMTYKYFCKDEDEFKLSHRW